MLRNPSVGIALAEIRDLVDERAAFRVRQSRCEG
jgi:hypothetical protein